MHTCSGRLPEADALHRTLWTYREYPTELVTPNPSHCHADSPKCVMPPSRALSKTWLWSNGRFVRLVSTASAFKLQLFCGTKRLDEMKVPKDVERRVQSSIDWLSSEDDPFDPYKLDGFVDVLVSGCIPESTPDGTLPVYTVEPPGF